MFAFIHAADLHLDSPLEGLSRYDGAPVDAIRGATRRAFEKLVDLAVEVQVAFVLLAGDLLDGEWRDHQTGIFLNKQFGILERNKIRVLVAAGNHDASSRITRALQPPRNVTYLSTKEPQSIALDDLGVVVHGQGFKAQKTPDNLARDFPRAERGKFNIGLLHTSLDGREGHETYAPCSLDDLKSKGYDYWALGHAHRREVVCQDPLIVFPGCTQGRHARETGAKGCTLVKVDNGKVVSSEQVDLDVVRWAQVKVDASGVEDEAELNDKVRDAIKAELVGDDELLLAVRVVIEGVTGLHRHLHASFERWRDQVRALGAEIGNDKIWVEKVVLKTHGKKTLEEAAGLSESVAGLLASVTAQTTTADSVPGLDQVVAELKSKLPPAFQEGEGSFDPASPEVLAEVIEEAKALLLSRLLTEVEP
ncbi:MAG: DNA repair exonuclease [Polyangia bacterium]